MEYLVIYRMFMMKAICKVRFQKPVGIDIINWYDSITRKIRYIQGN